MPTITAGIMLVMISAISRRPTTRVLAAAGLAATMLFTACGDDEPSAQEQYCQAGEDLRTSIDELLSLDLIAGGTDGLQASIDAVQSDLGELRDTASDAAAGEIDQLSASFDALQTSVADLGGNVSTDSAADVVTAIQGVGEAAQAVFGTLTDC